MKINLYVILKDFWKNFDNNEIILQKGTFFN